MSITKVKLWIMEILRMIISKVSLKIFIIRMLKRFAIAFKILIIMIFIVVPRIVSKLLIFNNPYLHQWHFARACTFLKMRNLKTIIRKKIVIRSKSCMHYSNPTVIFLPRLLKLRSVLNQMMIYAYFETNHYSICTWHRSDWKREKMI